ncbi:MAG: AmmeMemoRadiSam system protein A [Candidatus Lindowbacteria bacterium]|nr:AmmeMemoRadiSam system protein A [Candidatus Lindowbacteria bacterium]
MTLEESRELIHFVRACVESSVKGSDPAISPQLAIMQKCCGAFVTLKKDDILRGCIGHIQTTDPLFETIPRISSQSALSDPRFPPVKIDELGEITIELSVLTEPRTVASIREVQVGRDGIIVNGQGRSGCFLPQVGTETGWSAQKFVEQCLSEKAGLPIDSVSTGEATLEVFEAMIFSETELT